MEGRYPQEIVDKLYPNAIMLEAMKIWALPDNKKDKLPEICSSGDYFGQLKKDGNFYQFVVSSDDSFLFSRTESVTTGLLTEKVDNVPHIQNALSKLPKDTIVIGEVYYPGKTSNEVRSIMGCKSPLAIKRQKGEYGWIKFFIHDIVYFNGVSLVNKGAWERYKFLKAVFDKLELGASGHIELAEAFEDNLFERAGAALEAGEEGMILKRKDAPYVPGKKPAWSSIKIKKVDYADVICTGFEAPTHIYEGTELETWEYWEHSLTGELVKGQLHFDQSFLRPVTKPYFHGWCGSITIGAYNEQGQLINIGSVSSGLTDTLKEKMKQEPNKYIGQVCMCQVMEMFEQALRHPIFKGFRDDKNAKECTLESIFGSNS